MNKIMKTTVALTMAAAMATACGNRQDKANPNSADTLTGSIQLSGAFALYPMVVQWADEFKELHPNVKIDISGGGAGKGITDVLSGMVDLGMVSREVYEEEVRKGAHAIAVTRDVVVPTISTRNPLLKEIKQRGITADMARRIWSGEVKTWGEVLGNGSTVPVHVYTRSDACGAAETFAGWFGKKQEQLKGIAVYGDPGLASAIQRDPVAIGMNNIAYAYDTRTRLLFEGMEVVPIDIDGNGTISADEEVYSTLDKLAEAVRQGKFPSPPARPLYLVSKGEPKSEVVRQFIEYVLGEGQKSCSASGFVEIGGFAVKN